MNKFIILLVLLMNFSDLKYGMFIHFNMSTFDGTEQSPGGTPVKIYNPTDLNVEQWIKTAKEAGMKYAVLTIKHSGGFCLWNSKVNYRGQKYNYDTKGAKQKDVLKKYMKACKKYGIKTGVYYCILDTHNSYDKINWNPQLPYITDEYFQFVIDQLTEINKKYPEIFINWIDIPRHLTNKQRQTVYDVIKKVNPNSLVLYNFGWHSCEVSNYTINLIKNITWPTDILNSEKFIIGSSFDTIQTYRGKSYKLGYEHCVSITDNWFWKPNQILKSINELYNIITKVWMFNGNLLLNIPPDTTGNIPNESIDRLMEIKKYLKNKS